MALQSSEHSLPVILLVDDDATLLALFERCLSDEFRVVTAPDGRKALQTLQHSGPFAVVVSDLNMPGMSGSTFLADVRSQAPQTVRVMFTGCGQVVGAEEAVKTGQVFRFLTKPCSPEELLQVVRDAVAHHRVLSQRAA